jgi:hypothetical protein
VAQTISIPKQNRRVQDNPHDTPVLTVTAGETFAQLTLNMDASDLTDPTVTWTVECFESRDGGSNFSLAARMTDQGRAGKLKSVMRIQGVGPLWPMFGRLSVSRNMSVGATLELGP